MLYTNVRPAVVDLTPYWGRPDAEQIRTEKKAADALTHRSTA